MKILLHMILVIISCCLLSVNVSAQQIKRHVAMSAYIYNFAKHVQWQNEEKLTEFHFHIIGKDENLITEMTNLAKTKTLRNKPIKVTSSDNLINFENTQLIFISKENQGKYIKLFDQIERKNILLISDSYTDKKLIMINFFDSQNGNLLFEINNANIINQNLNIMPDMILLGGTQVDVAALYQEGQQSLRSIQKNSEILENNVITLEKTLIEKTKELRSNKDSLNQQTLKITEQQQVLTEQTKSLSKQERKLEEQTQEIKQQQQILHNQKQHLITQTKDIKKGIILLLQQKNDIIKQQKEIKSQSNILDKQDLTINKQRHIMSLLIIIIFLVVILVLTIYFAYQSKRKSNKILEQRVAERTNELNTLNEALEDKVKRRTIQLENANKELEAFAYSVSHDLRAPLRAISGYTRILSEDYSEKIESEGQRICGVIQSEATRMGQLIDDLLSFSRLSRTAIHFSPIDMKELIEHVFEDIRTVYAHIPIQFTLGKMLPVHGDESLLKQVWVNLISNACKFSSKKETICIEIGCYEEATKIIFYIKDNGAGFDMKYIDKLFGVFQRLHNQKDFDGTGVGLAIVQRIIHRHDGDVWAKSEINNGSIFYISLPKPNNHEQH